MKRIMYLGLMLLIGAGTLFAQQWGPPGCGMWGWGPGRPGPGGPGPQSGPSRGGPWDQSRAGPRNENRETVTVTGKLERINGQIALKQGQVTYYTAGLQRLIGFVDGLKEGAEVTLEGIALPYPGNGETLSLLVSKLTLNGKEYDNLNPALTGPSGNRASPNPPPQQGTKRTRHTYRYLPPQG
jgi:hypothetical protein